MTKKKHHWLSKGTKHVRQMIRLLTKGVILMIYSRVIWYLCYTQQNVRRKVYYWNLYSEIGNWTHMHKILNFFSICLIVNFLLNRKNSYCLKRCIMFLSQSILLTICLKLSMVLTCLKTLSILFNKATVLELSLNLRNKCILIYKKNIIYWFFKYSANIHVDSIFLGHCL